MIAGNEQHDPKESFYHLDLCLRIVAEKFGKPSISDWTNRDYIKLSGIVSRHTDVLISASTLKRIFGKLKTSDRYYPQKATRDALANYIAYTDWASFVEMHPRPAKEPIKESPDNSDKAEKHPSDSSVTAFTSRPKKLSVWLWLIIMIVITGTVLLLFQKKNQPFAINKGEAKLICDNSIGESPHSAVFKLQLSPTVSADTSKFTIDFGDGRSEGKIVSGALVTHYYELPGRFYAILKYDGTPLDTLPVYLTTNGWTATAKMQQDTTRVYPVSTDLFKNGTIQVTPDEILHSGVDTNRTFWVHFVNAKPFEISGDNFELLTNVTTSLPRPGIRCSQVNITLYGEKAQHTVVIIKHGCESWAYLRFSEVLKNGSREDLNSIGTDLTKGGTIRLQVIHKKVTLLVNEKKVYQTEYEKPLGELYGANVTFAGIGTVTNFHLKDLKSGKRFSDGFTNP